MANLLLRREAKRSTSGVPKHSIMFLKTVLLIDHSVLSEKSLDSLSASTLSTPGMCAAESQMSLLIQ